MIENVKNNQNFIFIICLMPAKDMLKSRIELRKICAKNLIEQTYKNWKAIMVGDLSYLPNDDRFIKIEFEGVKEEKLQIATQYILDNSVEGDYIIRLDDDDLFNPNLLSKISNENFDIYTDLWQAYLNQENGLIAQKVMYYYPNTCILKREHALFEFGEFPHGNYRKFRNKPRLFENEHNHFQNYFSQKHIIRFADKDEPVYLRIINSNSITFKGALNIESYWNSFGTWRKKNLNSFKKPISSLKFITNDKINQGFIFKIREIIDNLIAMRNYFKIVINKI